MSDKQTAIETVRLLIRHALITKKDLFELLEKNGEVKIPEGLDYISQGGLVDKLVKVTPKIEANQVKSMEELLERNR